MQGEQIHTIALPQSGKKTIKCVVWDLDNTLWDGILLEDGEVTMRPGVIEVIKTLDSRGILNSIASRNDPAAALERLAQLGISEYFLYPQINWGSKSASLQEIARALNLGIDTFAFVDDQPFELEEVAFSHADVLCIDARDIEKIPDMPAMQPRFITEDAQKRRLMYISDAHRDEVEKAFTGPQEAFLAGLNMVFTIAPARANDLQRVEELTVRTHQLNATGYTYSYEELDAFRQSDTHKLLIAGLEDKYGSYGKIGLALVECQPAIWTIKLLLMSCRVVSRGVGALMLNHIMRQAKAAQVSLHAEFIPNSRNRMMQITYAFNGFKEINKIGEVTILANDLAAIQPLPAYVQVCIEE